MITHISFEEILPIWRNFLWPNRTSSIDSHSAMNFKGGYDLGNMKTVPTFFAYIVDNKIAGINSGHMCQDNSYRSRGLWVFPEYQGNQIGKQILMATIQQGVSEGADYVWSYPKDTSWKTYNSAGFELASDWENSETGTNAYCKYVVNHRSEYFRL
jgi:GNAT superfamily N-acetyltransferase